MTLAEQIYAQARMMTGELTEQEDSLLQLLSRSAGAALVGRLREGVRMEDCRADLAAAGSLYALAALAEGADRPERFTAGELTIQRGSAASAAHCLRSQAQQLAAPYVRDSFAFRGV